MSTDARTGLTSADQAALRSGARPRTGTRFDARPEAPCPTAGSRDACAGCICPHLRLWPEGAAESIPQHQSLQQHEQYLSNRLTVRLRVSFSFHVKSPATCYVHEPGAQQTLRATCLSFDAPCFGGHAYDVVTRASVPVQLTAAQATRQGPGGGAAATAVPGVHRPAARPSDQDGRGGSAGATHSAPSAPRIKKRKVRGRHLSVSCMHGDATRQGLCVYGVVLWAATEQM